MPLDIAKITAALNAYPWTRGAFSRRHGDNAVYCAVGLLLRYAGVPQAEIASAGARPWARYHELLETEYGITGPTMIVDIILANDSAISHEEAIEQVQFVLEGGSLADRFLASRADEEELAAAAQQLIDDDGDACGAVLA